MQPLYVHTCTHTMTQYQCPYHLHVVDHCLQQAKLVLTAKTTSTAYKQRTTHPHIALHCATHKRRCVQLQCRLRSAHWRGRENCRERSMETCKQIHGLIHARTSHCPLTCCFAQGQAGLRGGLSLCRAQDGSWGSSCSDGNSTECDGYELVL